MRVIEQGRRQAGDPDIIFSESLPGEKAFVIVPDEGTASSRKPVAREALNVLITLAGRGRMLLAALALGALGGLLLSFILPAHYVATARILPPQASQSALTSLLGQLGPLAAMGGRDLGLKNPSDIYVDMLQSRKLQDELIRLYDLKSVYGVKTLTDARKKLTQRSTISASKDGLISINVDDKSAKRSADLANAYVSQLYLLNQNLATTEAGQRRLFYEQQLDKAKEDLARAEVDLKQTEEETGVFSLEGQGKAAVESSARLQAQIAAKEVELRSLSSFATEQNPDLLRAREELAGLRQQLAILQSKQSRSDISTGKFPEAGLRYVRKLREVKYRETLFEILARQYEAAKLDESKNAAVIQTLDDAVVPEKPSYPQHGTFALLGALIALLLGVVAVLAVEAGQRMMRDPERSSQLQELRSHLAGRSAGAQP
ncbi:MAG TPA: Wzz/FepE/Etk N-terminal domain-containing protein [Candidatus Limnocylindrales bacterium]|nr:Wzz/FepE/Etk N-terminal domain-containing protein [Candidatus Limnocylindrales bacterium]